MSLFDLIMIGISLSMDAFAVSICKGLSVRKVQLSHALICGAWFGAFQAIMPSFGYFLGSRFEHLFNSVGPWVAFILLAVIGVNMVRESFGGDETVDNDFSTKAMLPLAVATSIDAFAVGVGFAAMEANIVVAALLIGCTTFTLSAIGVKVGAVFGDKYRAVSERIGGLVLILIGLKTLIQSFL
jgi:putative Mn2+ efflux pump MntP